MPRIVAVLALLPILAVPHGHAQTAPAQPAPAWDATIDIGMRHLLVREYDRDGRKMVDERGWLPGLEAAVGHSRGTWRLELSGATYRNDIDYRGQLQRGAPFATDTATSQHRIGAGMAYAWNDHVRLHAALEWDRWQRRIDGRGAALGLDERYTSMRVLGGIGGRLWRTSAADIGIKAMVVLAQPERLRVRFDRQLFDDAHLKTRSASGLRTGVTVAFAALPRLSLAAEADWMRIARSADVPLHRGGAEAGTVAQPEHDRFAVGLRAGYRF